MLTGALRFAIPCGLLASSAWAQPGGCCYPNGACSLIGQFECSSHGGIFLGSGTTCADCGPIGACCMPGPGGIFCQITSRASCTGNLGAFHGAGSICDPCHCYANCDSSTSAPLLNINDFVCFQNRFAAGDPYANCDGSTTPPLLSVSDFICFLNAFSAGCP